MRALLLTLALTGCGMTGGANGVQTEETNQLARVLEARYHQRARVTLTADSSLYVALMPAGAIDPKFSQTACDDFAQRVARFALNHYSRPASVQYVFVRIILTQPASSTPRRLCQGGGPHGSLPPDDETPAILKGAGAR